MMDNSPETLTNQRSVILKRFRNRYWLFSTVLTAIAVAILAWHWSIPRSGFRGFPPIRTVPILAIAGAVINVISFYLQERYVRRVLNKATNGAEFNLGIFAFRFYLYNLGVAAVLSVASFMPLLALLFANWIYPIALWLTPYHLLLGCLLGLDIRRGLRSQ